MAGQIVVGINGSDADAGAVARAAEIAAREGVALEIVCVVVAGRGDRQFEQRARELLAEHESAVRESNPDLTVVTKAQLCKSLPEGFEAVSEGAKLFVIARDITEKHSAGTVRIAAASKAPVLAIPAGVTLEGRSGIVVGADGSEIGQRALAVAAAEADKNGEPLITVMAWQVSGGLGYEFAITEDFLNDWEDGAQQELEEAIAPVQEQYPNLEIKQVVAQGYPAEVLAKQAKTARLLVVGSHGRGAFGRLMLGSVSHELLQNATLPTLVVR